MAVVTKLYDNKLDGIPKEQLEIWEEGRSNSTLEKLSLSDWYPTGIEGPPYINDSRGLVNMDVIFTWLGPFLRVMKVKL